MQIFEDEDESDRRGDGFADFAELSHHPLPRRTENLALQQRLLVTPDEGWKLNQPGGRVFREQINDRRSSVGPDQTPERFQQWVIGFLTAESFGALAANDKQAWSSRHLTLKRVNEAGLADSRFADDEHNLATSAERESQMPLQVVQLRRPADDSRAR